MAENCRSEKICTETMKEISSIMDPLSLAIKASQDAFTGSLEERDALDKTYNEQQKASKLLTILEEQMIPSGYATPVPKEYSDLPQLKQRAKVEMVLKKGEAGGKFDINGVNFPEAKMVMVIDGYAGMTIKWSEIIVECIVYGSCLLRNLYLLTYSFSTLL